MSRHVLSLIVLFVLGVAFPGIGAYVGYSLITSHGIPAATCPAVTFDASGAAHSPRLATGEPAKMSLPAKQFIWIGLLCVVLGHLAGYIRTLDPGGKDGTYDRANRLMVLLCLTVFFLFVAGALFFEAAGQLRLPSGDAAFEPITYYVRCAIHYDMYSPSSNTYHTPYATYIIVVSFSFMLGHWLWPPLPVGRRSGD